MASTIEELRISISHDIEVVKVQEITKLNKLEGELYEELASDKLTTAQRVGVLSEVRKVIYTRCLLTGAIALSEHES